MDRVQDLIDEQVMAPADTLDSTVGSDGQDALVWECTNHDPAHQGASPGALRSAHGCAGFVGVAQ